MTLYDNGDELFRVGMANCPKCQGAGFYLRSEIVGMLIHETPVECDCVSVNAVGEQVDSAT